MKIRAELLIVLITVLSQCNAFGFVTGAITLFSFGASFIPQLMHQENMKKFSYKLNGMHSDLSGKMSNLSDRIYKQNNENYVNTMLKLNGIDGKFDSVSAQVYNMQGKIIDVTFMLKGMDEKIGSISDLVFSINGKMDKFSDQLADLSSQISDQTLKLKVEIKFQNFFTLMSRIKRFRSQLDILTVSYTTNSTGLGFYVDKLIEQYREDNPEYEIVNYIDFEFIGTNSLINAYIDLITLLQDNHLSPVESSTNKMIWDFYMTIGTSINEGVAFLKLCYSIRQTIKDEIYAEDQRYVDESGKTHNDELTKSFKNSLDIATSSAQHASYINLQTVGNLDPKNAASRVYVGKMKAEMGCVITGVRFRVEDSTLFLQIQTAKLGPMASVNETYQWQPLPANVSSEFLVAFEPKENYFRMDKFWFTDHFLTSLKLDKSHDFIGVKVFGRKIDKQSFSFGIMNTMENGKFSQTVSKLELNVDGKEPGLASDENITYSNYTINKDLHLVFGIGDENKPVSLFDTKSITYDIKSPIAGIGFMHYTNNDDYAGYIRPYLVALNYRDFFKIKEE